MDYLDDVRLWEREGGLCMNAYLNQNTVSERMQFDFGIICIWTPNNGFWVATYGKRNPKPPPPYIREQVKPD